MKIAITGHSAGIGQALAKQYKQRGHDIVGLSKRDGNNIHNITKIADAIEPCDMFINNAQSGYAQTELLVEMHQRWQDKEKYIINISTMLTLFQAEEDMVAYRTQKQALETAHWDLIHRHVWPQMTLIKPGEVNTGEWSGPKAVDVDKWAEFVVNTIDNIDPSMKVYELSLGADYAWTVNNT